MTRPRGSPPMPSAMSRPSEPVEMASTSYDAAASPRRMTEPFPNCFSICPSAALSAFLRLSSMCVDPLFACSDGKKGYHRVLYKYTANCVRITEYSRVSFLIQSPRIDNTVCRARITAATLHQDELIALHAHRCEWARPFEVPRDTPSHLARERDVRPKWFA